MKNVTKVIALIISLVMITGILSACSGSASNLTSTETTDSTKKTEDTSDSSNSASDSSPAVLTIGSNADVLTSLDKFNNSGFGSDDTSYIWGDPLIANDHKSNYTAALATEWTMADDALSWTFTLKQGVKFHNGEDFTSADVKTTYERLVNDKTLGFANSWTMLDHVETPDTYTAVIYLKAPMPTFLSEVGFVPIICSSAFEADPAGFFLNPVGTGAYKLSSFDKLTGEVHFVRNESWWGTNTGNIEEIVYMPILEDTTRASALRSGEIDIATQLTNDYHDILDTKKYTLVDVTSDTHAHIEFNCAEGSLFNDLNLRKALSMCIDRTLIVDSILGGGSVATWPVPEGNIGFVAGNEYVYDVEAAKALVEASGYNGEEIALAYSSSNFTRIDEVAQAIQSMAAEVGLNITLDALENATFMDRRNAGNFDITLATFASTCGDPQVEASVIIAFDVFHSGYVNDEMHQLCIDIQTMTDLKERTAALEKIFTIEMNELAPFSYLFSPINVYAMGSNISNITIYADGSADYRFAQKK